MSAQRRGIIIFIGILVVGIVICGWVPFSLLPSLGIAMGLPIIEVPGEVVVPGGWFFGINLTNTLIGTVAADVLLIVFVLLAWRASNGWRNRVPGKFQGWVEVIIETLYNFLKGIGGDRLRTTPMLWPIVATIFLFLLTGNLMKLLPGYETVGKMHCAHVGKSGYPITAGATAGTYLLYVDAPLNAGTTQTEETEHACAEFFSKEGYKAFPVEDAATIEANRAEAEGRVAQLSAVADTDLTEDAQHELVEAEHYVEYADARIASAEQISELEAEIAHLDEEIAALEGAADDEHGAVESEEHVNEEADVEAGSEASEEGDVEGSSAEETTPGSTDEEGEGAVPADSEEDHAAIEAQAEAETAAAETPEERLVTLQSEREIAVEQLNLAHSQLRYPGASLALSPEALDKGAIPFIFHITPFFRGPATDLSLTIALAIISMVLVQIYGVMAQGPAYFEKFINVSALGNLSKKPMGAIDFIVGVIEIISEIGKIVSLAFRLFGNLFAGGVALMAISFLVSLLVPGIIYGLELIIGTVQALVFCVLTLVFSVQAMEAHHGDHGEEGHHGESEHDEGYYDSHALEPGKQLH